jgi:hypothetical protein
MVPSTGLSSGATRSGVVLSREAGLPESSEESREFLRACELWMAGTGGEDGRFAFRGGDRGGEFDKTMLTTKTFALRKYNQKSSRLATEKQLLSVAQS